MNVFPSAIIISLILFLVVNYFKLLEYKKTKTSIKIVNEMGLGYNLGNTFKKYKKKWI